MINKKQLKQKKGKNYAEICFIGDVHLGSAQCDRTRFEKMIEYCTTNQIYLFLMGDLIENASKHSVGAGVYEQIMTPRDQMEELVEILQKPAKLNLILGMLTGNHEQRTYKESGFDPSKIISSQLKIKYLGAAGWNLWKVGSNNYKIYTLHGSAGSRYIHTKLGSLEKISHSFNADVVAMGHVHSCISASLRVQDIDMRNRVINERKKYLIITGHYLKYGGYSQELGMPIEKMGSPKIKLYGDKKDIHVSF